MFCWTKFIAGSLLAATLLSLGSCESEKQPATFYPIDSLVSSQVEYLTSIRAALLKEAVLDGTTDTARYVPSDTEWRKELEIFNKLNEINKPVNKSIYEVTDGLLDTGSNLTVKSFTSLEDLPIVYLKVYYQGTLGKPRKIEAVYDEQNLLFGSARVLSMHFRQVGNQTVLTSYSIEGGQRMILSDSVVFSINGRVLIDQ